MGHLYTSSSPALTNSSGVRTPRVRKAEDLSVGVRYSRADFRLDRRDGMVMRVAAVMLVLDKMGVVCVLFRSKHTIVVVVCIGSFR